MRMNQKVVNFGYTKIAVCRLVNLHALRSGRPAYRWHLGVVRLAILLDRLVVDVRLEALVEVVCAHAGDNNGEDEQEDGEHSEGSQGLACWLVVLLAVEVGNVHADELEQEVAHGDEVYDDDGDHASDGFTSDPPSGREQEEEGYDQGDGREGSFDWGRLLDDNEELDCEGEEEEEVELEESDVNLK